MPKTEITTMTKSLNLKCSTWLAIEAARWHYHMNRSQLVQGIIEGEFYLDKYTGKIVRIGEIQIMGLENQR
jgi:hypothetical protein